MYCNKQQFVFHSIPLLWAMCLLGLHPLFFSLHCLRLWVNGGVELHSEAGWIVNDLKRCHMQSTIWPPGGRHSILKYSIFTHYRCFFLFFFIHVSKALQTCFLFKLVVIGIYVGTFMQTLYSYFSKIFFCVTLTLSYISPVISPVSHVMSRATQIKL